MEVHELTLACHQLTLALNYVLTLKSLPENPAYSCVLKSENVKLFEDSLSKTAILAICMLPHLEKSKMNLELKLIGDASFLDILLGYFQPLQSSLI